MALLVGVACLACAALCVVVATGNRASILISLDEDKDKSKGFFKDLQDFANGGNLSKEDLSKVCHHSSPLPISYPALPSLGLILRFTMGGSL